MEFVRGQSGTHLVAVGLNYQAVPCWHCASPPNFFFTTEVVGFKPVQRGQNLFPDPDPWPWPLCKHGRKGLRDWVSYSMVRQVQTQTSKRRNSRISRKYWLKQPFCTGLELRAWSSIRPCRCSSIGNTSAHHTKHGKDAQRYFCQEAVIKVSTQKKKAMGGHLNPTYFVSTRKHRSSS